MSVDTRGLCTVSVSKGTTTTDCRGKMNSEVQKIRDVSDNYNDKLSGEMNSEVQKILNVSDKDNWSCLGEFERRYNNCC